MDGLNFRILDCRSLGSLGGVVQLASSLAEEVGFDRAYSWGKKLISQIVGYDSPFSALQGTKEYDIAIKELAKECEKGDGVYRARQAIQYVA